MARSFFKKKVFPTNYKFERAFFVFMTGIVVNIYMHFWMPIPNVIYEIENNNLVAIIFGLNLSGYVILLATLFHFDFFHFMSLK